MGSFQDQYTTLQHSKMIKGLFACLLVLSVMLIHTEACGNLGRKLSAAASARESLEVQTIAEQPESRFFFLALARARCRSTCAAVSYASTTSCTLIFSTLPCNVIFPLAG